MNFFLSTRILVLACVLATVRFGWSQNTAALVDRLKTAADATSLIDPSVNQFYLRLDIQLYDAKGSPKEKGTLEEWWAGHSSEKRVYKMPSYAATEIRKAGVTYRSKGASYPPPMLSLLLDQVIHPLPDNSQIEQSILTERLTKYGNVPLECILVKGRPDTGNPPPDFCFDPGKDSLRIEYEFGNLLVLRNGIGRFQGKQVPIDTALRSTETMAATAHISALAAQPVPDPDEGSDELTERVASSGVAGIKTELLSRADVIYPESAKRQHGSGTVVLHALIGLDRHIRDLSVVSSPSPILTEAAMDAVRRWIYAPPSLNGQPIQVETTVSVNFKFG